MCEKGSQEDKEGRKEWGKEEGGERDREQLKRMGKKCHRGVERRDWESTRHKPHLLLRVNQGQLLLFLMLDIYFSRGISPDKRSWFQSEELDSQVKFPWTVESESGPQLLPYRN